MLKYMVVLMGALVVLAASDGAQARGQRRSRGSCPNGQCTASIPAAAKEAVASSGDAAPAPTAEVTANVAVSTFAARTSSRWTRGTRFFRRR